MPHNNVAARVALLLVAILLVRAPAIPATSTDAAFESLNAASRVVSTSTALTPSDRQQLVLLMSGLVQRYNASKNASPIYAATIAADARAITRAVNSPDPAASRTITMIQRDLKAKDDYAKALLGAQTGLGNDLDVTVTAQRNNKNVPGLFVKANAYAEPNAEPALVIFSTPTETNAVEMAPGYYVFWLQHGSKHGRLQEVQIGNVRGFDQDVTLDASDL